MLFRPREYKGRKYKTRWLNESINNDKKRKRKRNKGKKGGKKSNNSNASGKMKIPTMSRPVGSEQRLQPHRRALSHGSRKNQRDRRIELVVRGGIIHGSGAEGTPCPGPRGPQLPRFIPLLVNSLTFPSNESPPPLLESKVKRQL